MKYDYKIGLQKTLKNVSIVLAPSIVLEILSSTTSIIPPEYLPYWQLLSAGLAYFIKNASENGAWKKKA